MTDIGLFSINRMSSEQILIKALSKKKFYTKYYTNLYFTDTRLITPLTKLN